MINAGKNKDAVSFWGFGGLGFRVYFLFWGVGLRVSGLRAQGCRIEGCGLRVWHSGRVGSRVEGISCLSPESPKGISEPERDPLEGPHAKKLFLGASDVLGGVLDLYRNTLIRLMREDCPGFRAPRNKLESLVASATRRTKVPHPL